MIAFIRGKVHSYTSDSVILDNQGIGYRIYITNPDSLILNDEIMLYTYQYIREDAMALFGFYSMEEHDLFLRLISVKGLGPKTAMNMLAVGSYKNIIHAIEEQDVSFLKKMPGIGAKTAQQIVLDLKGKLVKEEKDEKKESQSYIDAIDALKALGYKTSEIQSISKELKKYDSKTTDEYIRLALALMLKRKGA